MDTSADDRIEQGTKQYSYDRIGSIVLIIDEPFMSNNTFCWIDIPVTNLDRAISFYTKILDDRVEKITEHGFEFGLLPHTDDNVSGCLCVMEDRKPSKDGPQVYLNVESRLVEAVKAVESQGGQVLKDIEQIGPYGHRAIIIDTEGNSIALYSKEA